MRMSIVGEGVRAIVDVVREISAVVMPGENRKSDGVLGAMRM
jgi:hypothetical protein